MTLRLSLLLLVACSSEKSASESPVKSEAPASAPAPTKKKSIAKVDCASLLSIDDVAKLCTVKTDAVKHEQRGDGGTGSSCTVSVRSTTAGQSNTVRVEIEADSLGSAKTKLALARKHADARDVAVGEEGVARTEKVKAVSVENREVTQTNETVRSRKGPYGLQLTHLVREGDQANIACTPDAVVELAKLVIGRLPD